MAQHATYASSGTDIRGLLADYAPPIAPGVLLDLLNADAADGQRVAKLLQAEPALSARVISVINSALFALRQPIHDVPRAVAMLGPARARSLALVHALRLVQQAVDLDRTVADQIWSNGILRALAARALAREVAPDQADEAFTLAMVQDLALPIMVATDPGFYLQPTPNTPPAAHFTDDRTLRRAPRRAPTGEPEWLSRERKRFGLDHAALSAELLTQWQAPGALIEQVARHHVTPAMLKEEGSAPLHLASFFAGTLPHVDTQVTGWQYNWLQAIHARFLRDLAPTPELFQLETARQMRDQFAISSGNGDIGTLQNDLAAQAVAETNRLVANLCQIESVLASERAEMRDVRAQALTDSLTKLLNRRGFVTLAERRLEDLHTARLGQDAARTDHPQPVCCMLGDLDDFKGINDTHGHDVGDRILRAFAKALRGVVEGDGIIGRIGGDEFAILVTGRGVSRAAGIARRFQAMIADHRVKVDANLTLPLRASLGVVFCRDCDERTTLDQLLAAADRALYEQKRRGKTGVHVLELAAGACMCWNWRRVNCARSVPRARPVNVMRAARCAREAVVRRGRGAAKPRR